MNNDQNNDDFIAPCFFAVYGKKWRQVTIGVKTYAELLAQISKHKRYPVLGLYMLDKNGFPVPLSIEKCTTGLIESKPVNKKTSPRTSTKKNVNV